MQNRAPAFVCAAGVAAAGPITVAGTQIGDFIVSFQGSSPPVTVAAGTFEVVASVAGQVQQTSASNLSGNTYVFLIIPQGWKSIQ